MPRLKEDAEYYRLAVAVSLLPCAAAITWADAQMVACGVVSPELTDVSLTPESDVGRMVSALDRFPNDGDFSEDATRALHRIFVLMQTRVRDGELTPRRAAQTLDSLTKWARFLPKVDYGQMVAAEDWFWIAQEAEAEKSLISLLDGLAAASHRPGP
jgi:hypothetical protein